MAEEKNVLKIAHFFDEEFLYDNILDYFNKYVLSKSTGNISIDFTDLIYFPPNLIVSFIRALRVAGMFICKSRSNFKYDVIDTNSAAFMFLYHINLFDMLEEYVAMPSEQVYHLDYILRRDYEYNKANRMLEFEKISSYRKLIEKGCNERGILFRNEEEKNYYIRNSIEMMVDNVIKYSYTSTLAGIREKYGEHYEYVVRHSINELVTNAIFHSTSESFVFFQAGIGLPLTKKINGNKDTRGVFISIGDLGKGFGYSLLQKNDDERRYNNEFNNLKHQIIGRIESDEYAKMDDKKKSTFWNIMEALYYSHFKYENSRREGLYELIATVTKDKGIVSVISGNCRIIFNRTIGNDVEKLISEYTDELSKNSELITFFKKGIQGVQVDIEIRGKNR